MVRPTVEVKPWAAKPILKVVQLSVVSWSSDGAADLLRLYTWPSVPRSMVDALHQPKSVVGTESIYLEYLLSATHSGVGESKVSRGAFA